MTIREKYNNMKRELKRRNEYWNYEEKLSHHLDIHSVRGKNEITRIFASDCKLRELDYKMGVIDEKTYKEELKIHEDCLRSINNIEIY